MSDTTEIQWANHTGGPYLGCSMVSPGCTHCYAMELAQSRLEHIFRTAYKSAGFEDWRSRPVWGDKATRVLSKGFWNDAVRLNKEHAKKGTVGRWFPSMIDWLDEMPAGIIDQKGKREDPLCVFARFMNLIDDTPNLFWLLLTKRPENCIKRLQDGFNEGLCARPMVKNWLNGSPPANVWVGTSVENQEQADKRIPKLLDIPARVRFLSVEPLLGPVDLCGNAGIGNPLIRGLADGARVDWVIVGGESGAGARPCRVDWIRLILHQCQAAGVKCFVKQMGANVVGNEDERWVCRIKHPKGGDPAEWPEDLRVREFPQ